MLSLKRKTQRKVFSIEAVFSQEKNINVDIDTFFDKFSIKLKLI